MVRILKQGLGVIGTPRVVLWLADLCYLSYATSAVPLYANTVDENGVNRFGLDMGEIRTRRLYSYLKTEFIEEIGDIYLGSGLTSALSTSCNPVTCDMMKLAHDDLKINNNTNERMHENQT
jgi:hypothetical protein